MATARRKPVVSRIKLEYGPATLELEGEELSTQDALDLFAGLVANRPGPEKPTFEGAGSIETSFGFSYDPMFPGCEEDE